MTESEWKTLQGDRVNRRMVIDERGAWLVQRFFKWFKKIESKLRIHMISMMMMIP
jgi:hypothetical protein